MSRCRSSHLGPGRRPSCWEANSAGRLCEFFFEDPCRHRCPGRFSRGDLNNLVASRVATKLHGVLGTGPRDRHMDIFVLVHHSILLAIFDFLVHDQEIEEVPIDIPKMDFRVEHHMHEARTIENSIQTFKEQRSLPRFDYYVQNINL
jgi:hypothetical protein